MQFRIAPLFFCLLLCLSFTAQAKSQQSVAKSKLDILLEKAKQRREQRKQTHEETGYLPADNSLSKEPIYEKQTNTEDVKSYDDLVNDFNQLFDKTDAKIEEGFNEIPQQLPQEQKIQNSQVQTKPATYTKSTAQSTLIKSPAIKTITKSTTKEDVIKVETNNEISQPKTNVTTQTQKSKPTTTQTVETNKVTEAKVEVEDNPEEDELEEDEFLQDHDHEFEDEDGEEALLDEDEGLGESKQEKPNNKPKVFLDKQTRDKEYLSRIKNALKSLEEDPWNEVKFNMKESMNFFSNEEKYYPPSEVEKYNKIALAFFRFAEGGLELDQGDFADFEDAEGHYLDSQDILDSVELKLNTKDSTDQELLKIIQTVKKYINEDIEYIEEMIDLS